MNIINQTDRTLGDNLESDDEVTEYQKDLLEFIRETRPEGTGDYNMDNLSKLIEVMKQRYEKLYPGKGVLMSEMSYALLYVDGELRKESNGDEASPEKDALKDYVTKYLDKYASQLLGINMIYDDMLNKTFFPDSEDGDVVEKY